MGAENQQLMLKEQDLATKTPVVVSDSAEPIDIDIIKAFRTSTIGVVGDKMSDEVQILILNVLEKGSSLDTAARYAMVSPGALKKYIDDGMEEASAYTEEMYNNGVELSRKALFAVECMQRMAKATVEMSSEFYDRCFESGNTHLMMWWLERLDPDKYSAPKKRIQQTSDVNVNSHAVVEFKFTAPQVVRSDEDNELYASRMKSLSDKYGTE